MNSLLLLPFLLAAPPVARVTAVDIHLLESGDTRLELEGRLFNPNPEPLKRVRVLIHVLNAQDEPALSFWLPDQFELDGKQTVNFKGSRFLIQPNLARIRLTAEPHAPTLDDPLVIGWILHGQKALLDEWGVQVDVDLNDPTARVNKALDILQNAPHEALLREAQALKQRLSPP